MTLKFAKLDKFVNKIRKFNELEKKNGKKTHKGKNILILYIKRAKRKNKTLKRNI